MLRLPLCLGAANKRHCRYYKIDLLSAFKNASQPFFLYPCISSSSAISLELSTKPLPSASSVRYLEAQRGKGDAAPDTADLQAPLAAAPSPSRSASAGVARVGPGRCCRCRRVTRSGGPRAPARPGAGTARSERLRRGLRATPSSAPPPLRHLRRCRYATCADGGAT